MKMKEWKEVRLEECVSLLGDGLHGTPKYTENGEYAFINGNNLTNGRIVIKPETKRINEDEYLKYKKNLTDRTIFVSINGTIGNVGTYNGEKIILGKSACYFNVLDDIDKTFIKYIVSSPSFKTYLETNATGTTIKNVSLAQMRNYSFLIPPLPTQQKIAAILSSLDDKIELNNKINTNLEKQAQALFKNWFVDFEPFGGKMPEGWKVGKLSEIADYLNGLAMQKFRPLEGEEGLPVLKIKELRQGCYDESSELCSPSRIKPEYIIHDGDVIFSWSGSLLVDIWCGGTCGLNQHLFKVTSQTYEKWFYYLWTKHHLDRFIFLAADKATTMGHIKREELDKAEVVIPDDKTYQQLTSVIKPIIDEIINNRIENRKLSQTRDELLPKLMNGEIEV